MENLMQSYKQYLRELTVSPDYQSRGTFNPYYELSVDVDKDIRPSIGDGVIKFKSVDTAAGTEIKNYGGKYKFQIELDDVLTDKYITVTKKLVKAHLGQKTRKDSTASSNVNEFLSLYFLIHTDYTDPADFQMGLSKKTGNTGILTGEGKDISYEQLVQLIDKDESADRDIQIGYNNSLAVKSDLGNKTYSKLYWVPRGKPEGVGSKNPSDIIIKLSNGSFVGYSNKISDGKDATPKINTNITAFYSKLSDRAQLMSIQNMIDDAWNYAASTVDKKHIASHKAISNFIISNEKFSESASKKSFANLARTFNTNRLKFYANDFYYPFRNNLIKRFSEYLTNSKNMMYLLNTVGYYTYDDPHATPCPYKLLIGSDKGASKIKEVSSDEEGREIFFVKNSTDLTQIRVSYDNKSQTFNVAFGYSPLGKVVSAPIVLRTRAQGGWSGKSLYITTSGFKIK